MQQKVQGLNKEFKRKDVNRARNLLMGKSNASTSTQIGYNTKQEDHKEGDVWVENKKTWTIKNGIKQTISKLDIIKKEVFMPFLIVHVFLFSSQTSPSLYSIVFLL